MSVYRFAVPQLAIAAAMALIAATGENAASQEPAMAQHSACTFMHPSPDCSAFALTSIGVFAKASSTDPYADNRVAIDWGYMKNIGKNNALGGALHLSSDGHDWVTAPMIRYRHWLNRGASLDLGVGSNFPGIDFTSGGMVGLVKFNPAEWIGLGIIAMSVTRKDFVCNGPQCAGAVIDVRSVCVGAELGGKAGVFATVSALILGGLIGLIGSTATVY